MMIPKKDISHALKLIISAIAWLMASPIFLMGVSGGGPIVGPDSFFGRITDLAYLAQHGLELLFPASSWIAIVILLGAALDN